MEDDSVMDDLARLEREEQKRRELLKAFVRDLEDRRDAAEDERHAGDE